MPEPVDCNSGLFFLIIVFGLVNQVVILWSVVYFNIIIRHKKGGQVNKKLLQLIGIPVPGYLLAATTLYFTKYGEEMKLYLLLFLLFGVSIIFSQSKTGIESLAIHWPESDKWKLGNRKENDKMDFIELIKEGESLEKWTELGTMTSIKGAINVGVNNYMNLVFQQTKTVSPDAKLTCLEKDEKALFPWILFKIECPNFTDDTNPESQLWYVVQGKTSLFSNSIAIKKKLIPTDMVEKWSKIFKDSKVITE